MSLRLQALGVKHKSLWAWHKTEIAGLQLIYLPSESTLANEYGNFVYAYSVPELFEILPARIDVHNVLTEEDKKFRNEIGDPFTDPAWLGVSKIEKPEGKEKEYSAHYGEDGMTYIEQGHDLLVSALGLLLIYGIEKKLFTV